jgi:uncharacterized alpha-E superfamily protein
LNSLYLFTRSADASFLIVSNPPKYYENIRRSTATFLGIAASTMSQNEAWEFMDLGRQLERADKTTRFLDISSYLPKSDDGEETGAPGILHWTAILRSCGAMGAFRAEQREISARGVVDFLIFSRDFPRSVRYCVDKIDSSLHKISGTPRGTFSNQSERESGNLLASINFSSTDDVFSVGLHDYLDSLQTRFNLIGAEIFETYVLLPERVPLVSAESVPVRSAVAGWQLEQQQHQTQR